VSTSLTAIDMARQPAVLAALPMLVADDLERARELLAGVAVVRTAGIGSSRHVAGWCAEVLDSCGEGPVACVLPAVGRAVALPQLRPDQALIIFSASGRTPALLELADRATGPVIAVVNGSGSPLGGLADLSIDCAAGAENVVAATAAVSAQLLVARLLAGGAGAACLHALCAAVEHILKQDLTAGGPRPQHVVVDGLAAQWVADEVALKLAEVAGLLATSESLVDHLHGPAAVVVPTLAMVDDADPNAALLGSHVQRVALPRTGDPGLDGIVRVVAGQVLALGWAQRLGIDPDDPRGLSKVTLTS
jgi:glucosamine--fructose-6-phosphate aminotransferase (isomerizing)